MSNNIITFQIGNEPYIPVDIADVNGNWVRVQMLADTGNMRTIISQETAARLGWSFYDSERQVQGVFGPVQTVPVADDVIIKIGDSKPVMTSIMITDSKMDLLGFDVVQMYYKVTYDGNFIIFEQRDTCSDCQILGGEGYNGQQPFF